MAKKKRKEKTNEKRTENDQQQIDRCIAKSNRCTNYKILNDKFTPIHKRIANVCALGAHLEVKHNLCAVKYDRPEI